MPDALTPDDEWLWGWDPTPGIVSAWAEADGRAMVWRRTPAGLVREAARFRPWVLLDRVDDLEVGVARLAPDLEVEVRTLAGPGALRLSLIHI